MNYEQIKFMEILYRMKLHIFDDRGAYNNFATHFDKIINKKLISAIKKRPILNRLLIVISVN